MTDRNQLLQFEESEFLKYCLIDFYKARGPGGQKKNKTESAVRLTLKESQISATAAEDRQQSVNRTKAVKRLKLQIAFEERLPPEQWSGQLDMNPSNKNYPLFCAILIDHCVEQNWQISSVATHYGLSTGKLIKILATSDTLWQEVNRQRAKLGHKPLKRN